MDATNESKWEQNRNLPTEEVLARIANIALPTGCTVEIVGAWVWVTFDAKPPQEVRQQLINLGFHWNGKRKCWQHPGGVRSFGSKDDPKETYGTVQVRVS